MNGYCQADFAQSVNRNSSAYVLDGCKRVVSQLHRHPIQTELMELFATDALTHEPMCVLTSMAPRRPDDSKTAALRAARALHPRPQSVRDDAFAGEHEFFDPGTACRSSTRCFAATASMGGRSAMWQKLSVSVGRHSISPIRPSSSKGFPDCCRVREALGAITNAPRMYSISRSAGMPDKMCAGGKP